MSLSFHSTGWRVSCRISLRKFLRSLLKSNSIWWISAPWPLISRHTGTDWGAKSNQQILNFARCQSLIVAQKTPKWAVELSQVWPFAFKTADTKGRFQTDSTAENIDWICLIKGWESTRWLGWMRRGEADFNFFHKSQRGGNSQGLNAFEQLF